MESIKKATAKLFNHLKGKRNSKINKDILKKLIETMFIASIRTEEAEPIKCHIVYSDPRNPDPSPPRLLRRSRWGVYFFEEKIEFTSNKLIKLANLSKFGDAAIAIYADESDLYIWGIYDQLNQVVDLISHERDWGFDSPGEFMISIDEPGVLSICDKFQLICRVKKDLLDNRSNEFYHDKDVKALFMQPINSILIDIARELLIDLNSDKQAHRYLVDSWYVIIKRIILKILTHAHGSSLLFMGNPKFNNIKCNYKMKYDRLFAAIKEYLIRDYYCYIKRYYLCDQNVAEGIKCPGELAEEFKKFIIKEQELMDSKYEIKSCIGLISNFANIDGAVIMDTKLQVYGFGSELLEGGEIACPAVMIKENRAYNIDIDDFGTRHRSMMRYCARNDDCLGFVVSQDGDVRAMIKKEDKLIVWDNIALLAYERL